MIRQYLIDVFRKTYKLIFRTSGILNPVIYVLRLTEANITCALLLFPLQVIQKFDKNLSLNNKLLSKDMTKIVLL